MVGLSQQLLQTFEKLPEIRQTEVLDFAVFLEEKERIQAWKNISDEEAAALRDEFREEDLAFSESLLENYAEKLKHEDEK